MLLFKQKLLVICIILLLTFISSDVLAETKVANFSFGKPHTENYVKFAFYIDDGKEAGVYRTEGKDLKETKGHLYAVGNTNNSFKVEFEDKKIFIITTNGESLLISESAEKGTQIYKWEYEGPVDGVGTFCEQCADGPKEATTLVSKAYLNGTDPVK